MKLAIGLVRGRRFTYEGQDLRVGRTFCPSNMKSKPHSGIELVTVASKHDNSHRMTQDPSKMYVYSIQGVPKSLIYPTTHSLVLDV